MTARLAILISGRGSNMAALLAARAQIPAEFAVVLSDQPEAQGLSLARDAGLPVSRVVRERGQTRAEHEMAMIQSLKAYEVTHLALAGFMRILSAKFLSQFSAVFNIHPSLLPAFPGLNTHARALAAGALSHGCTVHLVDAGIDTGPILAQAELKIRQGETPAHLAARVLRLEHALYPKTLRDFFTRAELNSGLGRSGPLGVRGDHVTT